MSWFQSEQEGAAQRPVAEEDSLGGAYFSSAHPLPSAAYTSACQARMPSRNLLGAVAPQEGLRKGVRSQKVTRQIRSLDHGWAA